MYTLKNGGTPWDEGVEPVAEMDRLRDGTRVMRLYWVERVTVK
jgi:hypothetical protein